MCLRCRSEIVLSQLARCHGRGGPSRAANCFLDRREPIHGGYDKNFPVFDVPEINFRRETVLAATLRRRFPRWAYLLKSGSLPCGSGGGLGWGQLRRAQRRSSALVVSMLLVSSMSACHRENRYFEPPKNSDAPPTQIQLSSLVAGQSSPLQFREQQKKMYEENAYHLSEGKRLYTWFNCVGCHAHGGGDSGPPLMDDQWIYGGEIDQIYLTIVQGRPNGMPAFGGKIPSQQIWQLAAYVRSMSGHGPKAARPGRDDHIQKPSEQGRRDEELRGEPANPNM
jgi:cytochrome c oxidase cbb3-type subunit III